MNPSEQIKQGRKLCLSAEYRGLDRNKKALKLIENNICSERAAAAVVSTSRSTIRRAKDAIKYGRKIGKAGNPPIFSEEEEKECYDYVRSVLPENSYYTDEEFTNEVISKDTNI